MDEAHVAYRGRYWSRRGEIWFYNMQACQLLGLILPDRAGSATGELDKMAAVSWLPVADPATPFFRLTRLSYAYPDAHFHAIGARKRPILSSRLLA